MRVTLKANSIEELLSLLEKNYGPDWYDKVSVLINEVSGQIEAAVEPLKAVDTQTALDNRQDDRKCHDNSWIQEGHAHG
jgi:hypothetical protein